MAFKTGMLTGAREEDIPVLAVIENKLILQKDNGVIRKCDDFKVSTKRNKMGKSSISGKLSGRVDKKHVDKECVDEDLVDKECVAAAESVPKYKALADAVLVFSVRRVDMLSRQREMLTSSLPQLNMMKTKSADVEYSDITENWVYV